MADLKTLFVCFLWFFFGHWCAEGWEGSLRLRAVSKLTFGPRHLQTHPRPRLRDAQPRKILNVNVACESLKIAHESLVY